MTASQEAKSHGLKSLAQAAELLGWTTRALNAWHKTEPQRFRILMQGCAIELGLYEIDVVINGDEWVKK